MTITAKTLVLLIHGARSLSDAEKDEFIQSLRNGLTPEDRTKLSAVFLREAAARRLEEAAIDFEIAVLETEIREVEKELRRPEMNPYESPQSGKQQAKRPSLPFIVSVAHLAGGALLTMPASFEGDWFGVALGGAIFAFGLVLLVGSLNASERNREKGQLDTREHRL